MARGKRDGLLIAGGGIAGCLAALAMARHRPEVPLLVVAERDRFGGDAFHLLFDAELGVAERTLVEPLVEQRWGGFYLAFPGTNRNLKAELAGFGPDALHRAMVAALRPDQYRLGARIVAVRPDTIELEGGETLKAAGAIDARRPAAPAALDELFETRVERVMRLAAPHRLDRPLLVDATVEQSIGFSFIQAVPLGPDRIRVGQVLVSERVMPDEGAETRLGHYLALRGWQALEAEPLVTLARPLPIGDEFDALWRGGGARVAKLGARGGFLQAASGRSAPDALRNALLLARQRDLRGPALHDRFAARARQAWRKRGFFRSINAALAARDPEHRRALAERLHRLEPGTLLRLYGEQIGLVDRRKIQQALRR